MEPKQVVEEIRLSHHQKVRLAITDIDGIQRGKYVHKDKFLSAVESGFGFCDVVFGWDAADDCYDNIAFTGWHTAYPDAPTRIDLASYRQIPWNHNVPFFLADFADGPAGAVCPRSLLKRVIARASEMGFETKFGLEFEWFNFRETPTSLSEKAYRLPQPISPQMFGYSVIRSTQFQDYFMALTDELHGFGVPLEGLHTETGPGVYEAAILPSNALEAADRGVLFKTGVKEIASRFGILPTFMAKWNAKLPGSSGHIHQSLWQNGTSAFSEEGAVDRMSTVFRQYIAGQLHCLPEILPLFAPTVNSYKRLVEGLWAPTRVSWGVENRTAALRAIPGSPKSARLETRVPGADINPYLAIAAALASGLYGVDRGLEPPEGVVGNAYASPAPKLPADLNEATERMAESTLARELFGEAFVEHFVNTRRWEWRKFREAVTSWELERYFEII